MTVTFLNLPPEIRLNIYSHVFSSRIAFVEAGTQEEYPSLLPAKAAVQPLGSCSGQVLRVCKKIRREAEPLLYSRTHFYILTQAFAGKLPVNLTNGTIFAPKVKNLTWQLNCDLMKYFYSDEFTVSSHDLAQLNNIELRCQAENWKGSFCGEWVDRQAFVRGREQMICYAQRLQDLMSEGCSQKVFLIENRTDLSRGRVVLRLSRNRRALCEDEMLIS